MSVDLYKTEVIYEREPWMSHDSAEHATLAWVDWLKSGSLRRTPGGLQLASRGHPLMTDAMPDGGPAFGSSPNRLLPWVPFCT